ncbi:MAG TPA: hypothetical protein VMV49_11885 [Candidatus Deferrimicrobium sp.]|nr:hypothetical protein [Candidatus Deferrimicrobium sp.]
MTEAKGEVWTELEKLDLNEDFLYQEVEHESPNTTKIQEYQPSFYQHRVIMKLPPSAKFILYLLKLRGSMNRKRIIQNTMMPDRTVGFALKMLLEHQLIEKEDPTATTKRSTLKGRKSRRIDHRITNYTLVSKIIPQITLEF